VEIDNSAMFDKDEQTILSALVPDEGSEGAGDPAVQPANATAPAADTGSSAPAQPASASDQEAKPTDPASAEPAPPQGDTRAALRASRRAEKRLRDQLDKLQAENEALRQGKPASAVDTSITDEELATLEEDFPLQAKIVRQQRALQEQLAANAASQSTPTATDEFEPLVYDPAVQEVIDGVPELVAWQYDPTAQDKFLRAIEYDKALAVDPDWKDRNVSDRFTEAARRAKAALSTAPLDAAPAAPPRQDPATVIANAQVQGPKGISDFRGGAPATPPSNNYSGMTDEQIMASLPAS